MYHALAQNNLLPAEHRLARGYVATQGLSDSETNHGLAVLGPMKVDTTVSANSFLDTFAPKIRLLQLADNIAHV